MTYCYRVYSLSKVQNVGMQNAGVHNNDCNSIPTMGAIYDALRSVNPHLEGYVVRAGNYPDPLPAGKFVEHTCECDSQQKQKCYFHDQCNHPKEE